MENGARRGDEGIAPTPGCGMTRRGAVAPAAVRCHGRQLCRPYGGPVAVVGTPCMAFAEVERRRAGAIHGAPTTTYTNTKVHLIHAQLRAFFPFPRCLASVNDALHRFPPLCLAGTKNPLRICTCLRSTLVLHEVKGYARAVDIARGLSLGFFRVDDVFAAVDRHISILH